MRQLLITSALALSTLSMSGCGCRLDQPHRRQALVWDDLLTVHDRA